MLMLRQWPIQKKILCGVVLQKIFVAKLVAVNQDQETKSK
jgi:hypothetical protein